MPYDSLLAVLITLDYKDASMALFSWDSKIKKCSARLTPTENYILFITNSVLYCGVKTQPSDSISRCEILIKLTESEIEQTKRGETSLTMPRNDDIPRIKGEVGDPLVR